MITVIANLKGGSGKSTVAFNLAVWLERHGRRVVGYDLDPQCTFSDLAMLRRDVGGSPSLTVNPLRAVLKQQLLDHGSDEVLIDVGAANLVALKEAMTAADRILIPVPPSQADVWATQRFLHIIGPDLEENRQSRILETIAFVNRADTNAAIRETQETEAALHMLPGIDSVLSQKLSMRTRFKRSLSEGLAVFEMWPGEKAALEFYKLASELYPEAVPVS